MLACSSLSVGYAGKSILRDLSFEFTAGRVILISGANGSGKSTLLRTMFGLLPAISGRVEWFGNAGPNVQPRDLILAGVRYLGQGVRGFPRMRVGEQLRLLERIYGFEAPQPDETCIEHIPMDKAVGDLSIGQRRLVALESLTAGEPRAFLLDEPLAALDQSVIDAVERWCLRRRDEGKLVVLVEHRLIGLEPDEVVEV